MNAVILFDKANMTWNSAGFRQARHTRYKAFAPNAGTEIGDIVVRFAKYDQIWDAKMQVIHPDGSITSLADDHIHILEQGSFKIATLNFGALQPGDIAELKYTLEYYSGFELLGPEKILLLTASQRGSLFHGEFQEHETKEKLDREQPRIPRTSPTWFFDHHLYTCRSELRLELDSESDHVFAPLNMSDLEGSPIEVHGWRLLKRYTWILENLKPVSACDDPHQFDAKRKSIHFGILAARGANYIRQATFENEYWSTIALGLRGFLKEYCEGAGALRKTVRGLTGRTNGPRDLVDSLVAYVYREFNASTPHLTLQPTNYTLKGLLKTKQGAGFELNLLAWELLAAAEIPAWPVFISTADRPDYRDLGYFNHAIVYCEVGDEKLFIDVCFPECGPGQLPFVSRVAGGLLVSHDRLAACAIGAEPCESVSPSQ